MGFFKKIFGIQNINTVDKNINDAESPTADQTELESIQEPQRGWYTMSELSEIGANTDSGVNITPINAFNRITTVFACVDRRPNCRLMCIEKLEIIRGFQQQNTDYTTY